MREDVCTYVHVHARLWSAHTCCKPSREQWFTRWVPRQQSSRSVYSANTMKRGSQLCHTHLGLHVVCQVLSRGSTLTMWRAHSALMHALEFHSNERKANAIASTWLWESLHAHKKAKLLGEIKLGQKSHNTLTWSVTVKSVFNWPVKRFLFCLVTSFQMAFFFRMKMSHHATASSNSSYSK